MENWPNFFIVGAIRSGTTSLYEYLKDVPSVYMSAIKEPGYFSKSVDTALLLTNPIRSKEKYLKLFENVENETAIGEASPTYLWDPQAPKLIHQQVPDAKIIIILRDPVDRAFSHYLMLVGNGSIDSSFEDVITHSLELPHDNFNGRIISAGFYSEQVSRYLNLFPRENIKIFIFEEFIKDTKKSVQEVLDFLKVNDTPTDSIKTIHNQFTIPRGNFSSSILKNKFIKNFGKRFVPLSIGESAVKNVLGKKGEKPTISEKTRKLLEEVYRNDISKLESILGHSLSWAAQK